MTLRQQWDGFLRGSFVGVTIAVLTILVGAMTQFFDDEIEASFFVPFWAGAFDWKSSLFWLLILVIAALLGLSQQAQARHAQQREAELSQRIAAVNEILRRVETLPPETFLADYGDIARRAQRTTFIATANAGTGLANTERAIRNVLGAIVELAEIYDQAEGAKYSANIMLHRPDWQLESSQPVSFQDLMLTRTCPAYPEALELVPSLSTTNQSDDFAPDADTAPLVLPLPRNREPCLDARMQRRYPVLPGAPWAFIYREYAGFPSVADLNEWLEQRSSEHLELVMAIRTYFNDGGRGAHVRSLVSMPILSADEPRVPIGVLNLHSNEEGLLAIKGAERFSPLIEPLRACLGVLLLQRALHLSAKSQGATDERGTDQDSGG